ncbi:MAG: General secretion pathway protein F [Nitrospira sp.]|jgi:general secretion pathway protein F|nr:MAG: General secretion pathway protein F [Nitrospira sp.]
MPIYAYKGLSVEGRGLTGIIDADNPRSARQRLRNNGIYPTAVLEQQGADLWAVSSTARPGSQGLLRKREVALLTRHLATLLAAGLPLVEALTVLIEQSDERAAKQVLAHIREHIREGRAFSKALESFPRDFTPVYVNMVRTGETAGTLEPVLGRLASYLDQQVDLKNKITNAIIYPAVMLCVGVGVLCFLMIFVVPRITTVFNDVHQALPWPTVVLIAVSRFLADYWLALLGLVLVAGAGLGRAVASPTGRAHIDRVILRLPLVGNVVRMVSISRLAGTLSAMLSNGVPVLDALDVAKGVMNNRVLEEAVSRAQNHIREGESIADPLKRSGVFPSLAIHMIAVGEKSGALEELLEKVSHIYDGEVNRIMTRLTSLMEPIMVLVMGVIVFFIVLAILLPIFQMNQFIR